MNIRRLEVALGIISGRLDSDKLSYQDYDALGYDSYTFSYYGQPDITQLKEKAENILLSALIDPEEEL